MEESQIKIYGWYDTNEEWLPIQVDEDGKLMVTM
ncbi:hypothetical protein ES708_26228 [subsurface metagenome]